MALEKYPTRMSHWSVVDGIFEEDDNSYESCDLPTCSPRTRLRHWQYRVCRPSAQTQDYVIYEQSTFVRDTKQSISYCAGGCPFSVRNTTWRYPCPDFRPCRQTEGALRPSPRRPSLLQEKFQPRWDQCAWIPRSIGRIEHRSVSTPEDTALLTVKTLFIRQISKCRF